jgi:23S rRNA pseudouridine1911/1915/1917 synthase
MNSGDTFALEAGQNDAGTRLDVFIGERLPRCSRSFAAQLISEDCVRVNGQPKKPGYRLKAGDAVRAHMPPPRPAGFLPESIPLDILFEDEHIVVVNKQPGLVVHPAPGHYSGTLVNGLLHHCPDLGGIGAELRPGIVHRLDKDTSGTLVVAKNAQALERLAAQFKSRSVRKDYLALVHGGFSEDSGTIRFPIGRHPIDRKRMSTTSRKPREAETRWRLRREFPGVSLLEVGLKTGRTHQIRVHFAAIGHPIIGDPVYGRKKPALSPPGAADVDDLLAAARRQMLHAWRLGFTHPHGGQALRFESPLPADMERLIKALEAEGKAED